MHIFVRHQLIQDKDGYILNLYLDPNLTEFSREFSSVESSEKQQDLYESVRNYIQSNLNNVKVNTVKIMIGSLVLTAMPITGPFTKNVSAASTSVVQEVQAVTLQNRIIINGQQHVFSHPPVLRNGTTYIPIRGVSEALGADVWWNGQSKTVGINKGNTKISFVVGNNKAWVNGNSISMEPSYIDNGTTMVPLRFVSEALGMDVHWNNITKTVTVSSPNLTYTVKSGDTLWEIANQYSTTVNEIKEINNLNSDSLYVGQKLNLQRNHQKQPIVTQADNSITYTSHTIQSGDNMWDLSIRYGIPMQELLQANHMTENSPLTVGQKITIPRHIIPVQKTISARHGEYLDWWGEAQYLFSIGKTATVTDFETGRSFMVKRTIGANHADCEPLTSQDAQIIKEIWGGEYSWKQRAVIVEVDGRRIAASMASMPHNVQYIDDNNFDGHFDIHFKNSTRHKDGAISNAHQEQIRIAAGVSL